RLEGGALRQAGGLVDEDDRVRLRAVRRRGRERRLAADHRHHGEPGQRYAAEVAALHLPGDDGVAAVTLRLARAAAGVEVGVARLEVGAAHLGASRRRGHEDGEGGEPDDRRDELEQTGPPRWGAAW